MAERGKSSGTLVIGLGRFRSAVTVILNSLERGILGIKSDSAPVERFSPTSPMVEADTSRLDVTEQFGVRDFLAAVVGMDVLKASVLITTNLVDISMEQIWVKAINREQGRILRRIGTHHMIYPEFNAGRRTVHLVDGRMLNCVEVDREGFPIVRMRLLAEVQGFTLVESGVRRHYRVNILGVISSGQYFEYAGPDTVITANDLIIVSGDGKLLDNFANRP